MANYLEDLGDLPFVKDISGPMLAKVNDKVVGIPYTVEGFGIVYNKSLVKAAEVGNYDSFVKMLQDMKARGINGFGLSQESYFLIGHILNTPFAVMPDMESTWTALPGDR
jgi:raffinose/stachyose/melibiose transport system substrate-binding protein